MSAAKKGHRSGGSNKSKPGRLRPLLWLTLPTLVLLPLVVISTFWYLPTRVRLELETARLALTLGGGERREIFNSSVSLSSLVIEDCGIVSFAAETLEAADPQLLVPGTGAQAPHFPAAAWRALSPTSPVKLPCRDPEAKLVLQNPDPAAAEAGILDRVSLDPGSQMVLEVSPGREPAVSLEIETPQDLHVAWGPDLELVADFVGPEGVAVPFQGSPLTWRARLPEARRTLDVTSGEHGLVLIVTPARGQAAALFPEKPDLPLASLELLEETLRGNLTSPLRGPAKLSYPDHPEIPAVTIEPNEDLGLGGLSQARLTSLALDTEKQALRVELDGKAGHAASRQGEFVRDHRLTLFHTVRYNWRWALIAAVAAWLASTTWAAFGVWKKLQE
jgi:hypothetical protein